jgi:hypothetical protein
VVPAPARERSNIIPAYSSESQLRAEVLDYAMAFAAIMRGFMARPSRSIAE